MKNIEVLVIAVMLTIAGYGQTTDDIIIIGNIYGPETKITKVRTGYYSWGEWKFNKTERVNGSIRRLEESGSFIYFVDGKEVFKIHHDKEGSPNYSPEGKKYFLHNGYRLVMDTRPNYVGYRHDGNVEVAFYPASGNEGRMVVVSEGNHMTVYAEY